MTNFPSRTSELDATYDARETADGANRYQDPDALDTSDLAPVDRGAPSLRNGTANEPPLSAREHAAEPARGEPTMPRDEQIEAHRGVEGGA